MHNSLMEKGGGIRMRKVLLICLLVSLLGTGTALAVEQVISANPLGLLVGVANVEYERVMDDDSSWAMRGLFWSDEDGRWDWSAFGAGASYRRYFSPPWTEEIYFAPAGWYWAVGADILSVSADRTDIWGRVETGSAVLLGPTAEVGYQWLFGNGFTVEVGAGLSILIGELVVAGEDIPVVGVAPGFTFGLGYAW